jgi:hypothetical protein
MHFLGETRQELLNPKIATQKCIALKIKFSLLETYYTDDDNTSLPYYLMNVGYQIVDINLEKSSAYSKAVKLAKVLFETLDENYRLFNIFSLVDSDITDVNGTSRFVFTTDNTFDSCKRHLKECLPQYLVAFNSPKTYRGSFLWALSDTNKLLFLNGEKFSRCTLEQMAIGLFLVILHEVCHIKRASFHSNFCNSNPLIMTDRLEKKEAEDMDMGYFMEYAVLVNMSLF